MFKKILIANRGEIAVRIIRAARELGINTVAVYSEADKNSLHTILADEAICIGPARSTDSYLNMNAVLSAAVVTGAEAIHPGFGFLSENSKFATMCEEMHIKFIGPSAEIMDKMGDKINARAEMIAANVPVIPGSDGEVFTAEQALEVAEKLGYPVMLKASAGGGGKGIRKVESAQDLVPAFESASQEALAAFGNGAMYIEKVVYPARHIEVQILGDSYGNVVHLGERVRFNAITKKYLKKAHQLLSVKLFAVRLVMLLYAQPKLLVMKMQVRLNSCLMKRHHNSISWK